MKRDYVFVLIVNQSVRYINAIKIVWLSMFECDGNVCYRFQARSTTISHKSHTQRPKRNGPIMHFRINLFGNHSLPLSFCGWNSAELVECLIDSIFHRIDTQRGKNPFRVAALHWEKEMFPITLMMILWIDQLFSNSFWSASIVLGCVARSVGQSINFTNT